MHKHTSIISKMKVGQFDTAVKLAIPVTDLSGDVIGTLVPVGEWILNDAEKIEAIRTWRSKARRMFLTQLDSTYEQTWSYLQDVSIEQVNRLLFLLFDDTGKFVGHLGICNVTEDSCELDNLMRGASGGDPRLVYFAEGAMLDWCFAPLGVSSAHVSVLSYNWMVIDLHKEVGFFESSRKALKKVVSDGLTTHQVVDQVESNVGYAYVQMHLLKHVFLQKWCIPNVHFEAKPSPSSEVY